MKAGLQGYNYFLITNAAYSNLIRRTARPNKPGLFQTKKMSEFLNSIQVYNGVDDFLDTRPQPYRDIDDVQVENGLHPIWYDLTNELENLMGYHTKYYLSGRSAEFEPENMLRGLVLGKRRASHVLKLSQLTIQLFMEVSIKLDIVRSEIWSDEHPGMYQPPGALLVGQLPPRWRSAKDKIYAHRGNGRREGFRKIPVERFDASMYGVCSEVLEALGTIDADSGIPWLSLKRWPDPPISWKTDPEEARKHIHRKYNWDTHPDKENERPWGWRGKPERGFFD